MRRSEGRERECGCGRGLPSAATILPAAAGRSARARAAGAALQGAAEQVGHGCLPLSAGWVQVHSIVLADPQQRTTADCLFLAYRCGRAGRGVHCIEGSSLAAGLARGRGRSARGLRCRLCARRLAQPTCGWHTSAPRRMLPHNRGPEGKSLEPEVYPRPDRSVYICGVSEDDVPVPATAADVLPRSDAIQTLRDVAASVSQVRCWLAGTGCCRWQGCAGYWPLAGRRGPTA